MLIYISIVKSTELSVVYTFSLWALRTLLRELLHPLSWTRCSLYLVSTPLMLTRHSSSADLAISVWIMTPLIGSLWLCARGWCVLESDGWDPAVYLHTNNTHLHIDTSHWSHCEFVFLLFFSGMFSRWMTLPSTTATLTATLSAFMTMKMSSWWFERAEINRANSKDPWISFPGSCSSPCLRTCRRTTPKPEDTSAESIFTLFYWQTWSVHSNILSCFARAERGGESPNTLFVCLLWCSRSEYWAPRLAADVYWYMRPAERLGCIITPLTAVRGVRGSRHRPAGQLQPLTTSGAIFLWWNCRQCCFGSMISWFLNWIGFLH